MPIHDHMEAIELGLAGAIGEYEHEPWPDLERDPRARQQHPDQVRPEPVSNPDPGAEFAETALTAVGGFDVLAGRLVEAGVMDERFINNAWDSLESEGQSQADQEYLNLLKAVEEGDEEALADARSMLGTNPN